MAERIKKHWDIAIAIGIGSILTIVGLAGLLVLPSPVFGDVATTVTVYATVSEWLTFTSSATSTTLSPDLLDASNVLHIASSSDITLTLGTNSADGYSITINGDGDTGLVSAGNNITLATATGTAATGTNVYGIQGVSSDMTIQPFYNWATSTNNVGRASTTADKFATDNAVGSGQIAYIKFKASCTSMQASGAYEDVITLTAVATP